MWIQLFIRLKTFFYKPFGLLDTISQRLRFVIVNGIFGILFINVFRPFNMERWFDIPGRWEGLFYSSFGLISILVIGLSQFAVRPATNSLKFRVLDFCFWALGEIFVLTFIFYFLFANDGFSIRNLSGVIWTTFRYTTLVAGLAYTFSLLINSIFTPKNGIVLNSQEKKDQGNSLVSFNDENGNFKFGIKEEDLLYLEAADNYVIIYFFENDNVQKQVLRNSLKNLEPGLKQFGIQRCHRSFMVHTDRVRLVRKEPKRYLLYLPYGLKIPASPTFYEAFNAGSIRNR